MLRVRYGLQILVVVANSTVRVLKTSVERRSLELQSIVKTWVVGTCRFCLES